ISLKLSKVKLSDKGTYECSIPLMGKNYFVKLVVGNLSGSGENRGGVVLQCESAGWYPEPELLWLDGDGNLLSAGPTETLRGPDDLYTVSSRVTPKSKSVEITCNSVFIVSDEFFELTSCSAAPIVIGLAVSLAVSIILILIGVFFIWRQNKTKSNPNSSRLLTIPRRQSPDRGRETRGRRFLQGRSLSSFGVNSLHFCGVVRQTEIS
uniref:Butyrophilin subfamily 3 member A2-like Ig-C domain-containing protein n=1 Tax=Maylandia zebra TaxID=106582 RepID=A0A3P9DQX8_9CICH